MKAPAPTNYLEWHVVILNAHNFGLCRWGLFLILLRDSDPYAVGQLTLESGCRCVQDALAANPFGTIIAKTCHQ
jgi:hypothetical protein